jgi:hypothetical protein
VVTGEENMSETITETFEDLRDEASGVVDRINLKMIEIQTLLRDGKFIVAYEKIGGVHKVMQQLGVRLKTFPSESK